MKRKALIFQGGFQGHEPEQVAEIFRKLLTDCQFEVEVYDNLDILGDSEKIKSLHLLVPVWTGGEIGAEATTNVIKAVAGGVGVAGCHGGMCDTFRTNVRWQFMTGGQWVAHPGNSHVEYTVNIRNSTSPLVEGIEDFKVTSEQYYMHIDPAIEVLASTRFPIADGYHAVNGVVDMPVVWTKRWGKGRVFYNSLGHKADIVAMAPVLELMRRGFLWAAEGKDLAESTAKQDKEFELVDEAGAN